MDLTSIIVVVSGKRFPTKINTLLNSEYFTGIIELNKNSGKYLEEIIVEDKSPIIFTHVLEYLRNQFYKLPRNCEEDLKFYGINYDSSNFELTIKDIYDKQLELEVLFLRQREDFDNLLDDLQGKNDHVCLKCSSEVYYDEDNKKYSRYCCEHVCAYSKCLKKATLGFGCARRCNTHANV
jgi:hypothetical protein